MHAEIMFAWRKKQGAGFRLTNSVPYGYIRRNGESNMVKDEEVAPYLSEVFSRYSYIKSKTVLRLRQKTSAFPFLPTRAFDGWNAGHSFLKNNSRTPNLNLIQSNRKLPTGSSISLKKAI